MTEDTTEVTPQPVLGEEIPTVDPTVEFAPQQEATPVSGDVAPEAVSHVSKTEESPGVTLFNVATSEESSPGSQGSADVAPEVPSPEAVVVKGVTLAESSPALDVASDVDDSPESVAPPRIVDEAERPAAENIPTSPPVRGEAELFPFFSFQSHSFKRPWTKLLNYNDASCSERSHTP